MKYSPRMWTVFSLATLLLVSGIVMSDAQGQIELKSGDRVVFLGDSITQAGARPGGYVSLFRDAVTEAMPDAEIEVIGAGISGHKVPDCQERLKRDVLDKEPTVVVIYIGINDVWHSTRDAGTPKDKFESGLKDLISRCEEVGARVLLCTPSVIGEKTDGSNSLDELLDEYCEISRSVAASEKVALLDLHKTFDDYLKAHNTENKGASVLTTDGVHLNAMGNKFVATTMLKAMGVQEPAEPKRLLRHIVMFKFKDSSGKEDVAKIVDAFAALPKKIDAIHGFEMGTDNSPEGLADGFTHCFMVTFKTEADRDIYLPHAAHKEFVSLIGPHVDKVLVFDYWAE